MYTQILSPYAFGFHELHNVMMDSCRHVVLRSSPETLSGHIWAHLQTLSREKYHRVLKHAHLINTDNPVTIDAGYYIPTYRNFYHTLIDGIPRAWGTFADKTHDLVMCQNHLDMFEGLRPIVENWLPKNSLTTYTVNPDFAVLPGGTATYGTVNRLCARKLTYFSATNTTAEDDPRIVNKRLAVAMW